MADGLSEQIIYVGWMWRQTQSQGPVGGTGGVVEHSKLRLP